jgi:hypothetical protein
MWRLGITYTHIRIYVERGASESTRVIDPSERRATSGDFAIEWRCDPFRPRGQGKDRKDKLVKGRKLRVVSSPLYGARKLSLRDRGQPRILS